MPAVLLLAWLLQGPPLPVDQLSRAPHEQQEPREAGRVPHDSERRQ